MSDTVVIVVPSTRRISEPLTKGEARAYVQKTKRFLAEKFGGATAIPGEGAWITSEGLMVEENITQVQSFVTSLSETDRAEVILYCQQLRAELDQVAIMLVINGDPIFVT